MAIVRFNKLPRSFARSKLIRSTNPSGVNTPSDPKGTSRINSNVKHPNHNDQLM